MVEHRLEADPEGKAMFFRADEAAEHQEISFCLFLAMCRRD